MPLTVKLLLATDVLHTEKLPVSNHRNKSNNISHAGLILFQRLRCWHNNELTVVKRLLFTVISQQTRDVDPMLVYCWPTICNAGPTVYRHWVNVSCLLGYCCSKCVTLGYSALTQLSHCDSWGHFWILAAGQAQVSHSTLGYFAFTQLSHCDGWDNSWILAAGHTQVSHSTLGYCGITQLSHCDGWDHSCILAAGQAQVSHSTLGYGAITKLRHCDGWCHSWILAACQTRGSHRSISKTLFKLCRNSKSVTSVLVAKYFYFISCTWPVSYYWNEWTKWTVYKRGLATLWKVYN